MEKINTDYKRRTWKIWAKLFKIRKLWCNSFKCGRLIGLFRIDYLMSIRKIVFGLQEKIRHLLRVSGVSSFVYWLELFISDAIIFLIPMVLMLILIPAFQLTSLSPAPAMGCLVIALLLYLPSGILFSYLLSFPFSSWDVAQQVLPNVFTFVSITWGHPSRKIVQWLDKSLQMIRTEIGANDL